MWNVTQGPNAAQNIGKHDAAIKEVKYIADKNLVITASWDKTLRAWDMRQPNPAATINFNERIYAMDAKKQAVVRITTSITINYKYKNTRSLHRL